MEEEITWDNVESNLQSFLLSPNNSAVAIIILNFTIGVLLGPTSFGLVYYLTFFLLFESIMIYLSKGKYNWSPFFMLGYLCSGIFGFILGRLVDNQFTLNPLDPGNLVDVERALEERQSKS